LQNVETHPDQPELVTILKALTGDLRETSPLFARDLAQELIELCQNQGKISNIVLAFFEWAMVEFAVLGNTSESKPVIEEALKMARQQEIGNLTMQFAHLLGAVHYQEGDLQEAKRLACEGLDIAHSLDDKLNASTLRVLMGDISLGEGDYSGAQGCYREALVGFDEMSRKPRFTLSLFAGIADLYAATKELEQATELGAFVQSHPFQHAYWSPHDRADKLLDILESKLPSNTFAAAKNRGRNQDLDNVFEQLLVKFASND